MTTIGPGPPEDSGWQRALVALARVGDDGAFETLVRLHQDVAYRVALRMTGSPQDAQDIVQDALLAAWRGLPAFRDDSTFGTWLVRIVINRCHNLSRSRHPTHPLRTDEPDTTSPSIDAIVVAQHHHEAAVRAVLALPFDQRAPLVLHTFSGHTYAQVGDILGISEGAARVRVHRARRALITELEDWS